MFNYNLHVPSKLVDTSTYRFIFHMHFTFICYCVVHLYALLIVKYILTLDDNKHSPLTSCSNTIVLRTYCLYLCVVYCVCDIISLPFGDNFCLKVLLIEGHEGYRYILYRSSARLLFAFGKMHYLAALRSVFHIFKVVTQKTTKHMIISFINSHD